MNKSVIAEVIFICICAVFFAGCNQSQTGENQLKTVRADDNTKHGEHRHGSGASPVYLKPGAGVRLENPQPLYMGSPGVAEFALQLSAAASTGMLQVEISTGEGLELLTPRMHEFSLTSAPVYTLPVRVSAQREGRFYINLHTRLLLAGNEETRVIAAAVQVGDQLHNAVMRLKKADGPSEESQPNVREMPAQETVSPAR